MLAGCTCSMLVAGCTGGTEHPGDGVTIDRIVAVSDGEHLASTYVDGTLAPPGTGFRDRLSTIAIDDGVAAVAHVDVPNSVTAAPEVLALSPSGDTAFVAERLGQRPPGATRSDQLAPGNRLTAVDVADLGAPAVRDTARVTDHPEAIAVSPDGSRIAVVANDTESAVVEIVEWDGTRFGRRQTHDLARLGVTGTAAGPRGGVLATNVQWHPSGDAIAVNIDTQDRVAFFLVDRDADGTTAVQPWGAPVPTGTDPLVGRFTPDGRHYITADWGRNLSTTVMAERLPRVRSTLSVISVPDPSTASPDHRVVDRAETDTSSEGLAVSPDGTLVATVNMRGTAFPPDSPRYDQQASVSLLRLDPDTGDLAKIGDYPLDAVLPEGGTFDATGQYFLATSYQGREDNGGAGIQIYSVDETRGLVPVQRITLPHGVHHVASADESAPEHGADAAGERRGGEAVRLRELLERQGLVPAGVGGSAQQ